jgi:hypothetical protein
MDSQFSSGLSNNHRVKSVPMELEPSSTPFEIVDDKRPKLEVPPPVRLVAVSDCVLPSVAGQEVDLDQFYAGILGFERDAQRDGIEYRAENFRLCLEVFERREPREDFIVLGISVPSLANLMRRLDELEIEYTRQRGLIPGADSILLLDPSGNVLEISEFRVAL